ncbi:hypothetical protein Q5Y75_10615 [Ruegeria sp. 2205SS24-7]|uniref:hypothetical protein n=1 Tax=Ruegeria discodermiae TaxID=3064389 RepID=UPI002741C7DD|nr:hypothetical protein [Ruegeria sp. 2205SS24-7]MDP5217671.1 hypothetical protein [Ruegeria sp. 2205SS24-7]
MMKLRMPGGVFPGHLHRVPYILFWYRQKACVVQFIRRTGRASSGAAMRKGDFSPLE